MKTLGRLLILAMLFLSASVSAGYCDYDDSGRLTSCTYNAVGGLEGTQYIVSFTRQGWALTIALYMEDFVMVEGDATFKVRGNELQTIEYVTTARDVAPDDLIVEAAVYKISEEQLLQLANAGGKVKFTVPAAEAKDQVVKVQAVQFKEIPEYIAETKAAVGL